MTVIWTWANERLCHDAMQHGHLFVIVTTQSDDDIAALIDCATTDASSPRTSALPDAPQLAAITDLIMAFIADNWTPFFIFGADERRLAYAAL